MKIEQLGPYRIVRELGRGGMGTVFEGVNHQTGEPAAVKLLSAAMAQDEDFRSRFEAEIETLRRLNHPNIVRLFGFGEQDGRLFYAMELVDGHSLEQELARGRRFDWREATQIGIEVCQALRHAHDRGVIHRDIKPGNLLQTADGHVKLSDFGIARLFGNVRTTSVGSVLGTAEYMAPEQAEARPVDARSDLYSLGAVLYVLLSRRPLFQGKSFADVLHKQRFEKPEPLSRYAPDCPAELEQIVGQLLEKEPEQRVSGPAILARRLMAMQNALSRMPDLISLPSTRLFDRPGEPPSPVGPAPQAVPQPAEELPGTKAATAVDGPGEPPPPPAQEPAGHFTAVQPDELDPHAIRSQQPRSALVSARTWLLAVGLIVVGLAAWYSLQPISADRLYDRIDVRLDGTVDGLLQAEADIEEFLVRFPQDPRAGRLRARQKELDLHRLERKFDRRAKGLATGGALLPIERAYLEAINYSRLDPERGMAKLQALIDLYDHRADASGPTGQCLELARRRLEQLRKETDRSTTDLQLLLRDRLDEADRLRGADPERARAIWRAVVELYADKPWAAEAVGRARAALEKDATK